MRRLLQFCNLPKHILNKLAPYTYDDAKEALAKNDLTKLAAILASGSLKLGEDDNLLILALSENKQDAVLFLIEQFPHLLDFNRRSDKGDSPLLLAIFRKMHRAIAALIPLCDLNACDFRRNTPFIAAAANGDLSTLQLLLSHPSCNPSVRNLDGHSALHRAAYFGQLPTVDWLLSNTPLKAAERDKRGCNALHLACEGLNIALTRYLVRKVKRPQQLLTANKEGKTPLDLLRSTIENVTPEHYHLPALDHLKPEKEK